MVVCAGGVRAAGGRVRGVWAFAVVVLDVGASEFALRVARRRSTWHAPRVRPLPAHQFPMPTQERRRCHHESLSTPLREQTSKRSDEGTIGRPKLRPLMLASHTESWCRSTRSSTSLVNSA